MRTYLLQRLDDIINEFEKGDAVSLDEWAESIALVNDLEKAQNHPDFKVDFEEEVE